MGYDVHITRAKHWLDSDKRPITLRAWLAYVEQDPEMEPEEVAIGRVKGKPVVAYQSEGLAVWIAYSGHDTNGNRAWFDWRKGRIVVKNPDEEILTNTVRFGDCGCRRRTTAPNTSGGSFGTPLPSSPIASPHPHPRRPRHSTRNGGRGEPSATEVGGKCFLVFISPA